MKKEFIPVLLLLALTYLPFLNQAFHIDDPLYLEVAANILEKPFFPYDYPALFEGYLAPDAASHSHLPLTAYYLALVSAVTGAHAEWVYHLAFLVFPLLALAGFFDLSRRFSDHPGAATCLLAVSPAFLVLSHTLSPDVPLLAFWLLALSRFQRVVGGGGGPADWTILTLSLLAASFISLLSVGLLALMAAFLGLRAAGGQPVADPIRYRILIVLTLPFLLWTAWYLRAYLHYDRFVLTNTLLHLDKRSGFDAGLIGLKGVSFLLNLGGAFVFPLALWWGMADRFTARLFLLLFLLCFIPFGMGYQGEFAWSWTQLALFSAFFSTGALILSRILGLLPGLIRSAMTGETDPGGNSPASDLAARSLAVLWFLGILVSCLFLFYSGSVRYTLLALPPLILIWIGGLGSLSPYFRRNLVWLAVALTLPCSLAIGRADYEFAATYRRESAELARVYSMPDRTLWFTGEWGFRYYMKKVGAKALTRTGNNAKKGDLIIKPWVALPSVTLYDGPAYSELVEQRPATLPTPIRTLDFFSHAGFYSTGWGLLPFSLSDDERWEWFNVFRIKQEYRGPIPDPEPPW